MNNYWDKPCAAAGLISYRYKGERIVIDADLVKIKQWLGY